MMNKGQNDRQVGREGVRGSSVEVCEACKACEVGCRISESDAVDEVLVLSSVASGKMSDRGGERKRRRWAENENLHQRRRRGR